MLKSFIKPEYEMIRLDAADVIVTSLDDVNNGFPGEEHDISEALDIQI